MAKWTTNVGQIGNMLLGFQFPTAGINVINITPPGTLAEVQNNTDFNVLNGGVLELNYLKSTVNLAASGANPTAGNYQLFTVQLGANGIGDLTEITINNNFVDIDSVNAWKVLDGNDTLNGNTVGDTLTGGFGGSDSFNAFAGNDTLMVATLGATPSHVLKGGSGFDTVSVLKNIFTGATALDLRGSTFSEVEKLKLEAGIEVSINASQFGGLSAAATIEGAGSTLHIFKNIAGTLDLRGLTVSGPAIVIHAGANTDTFFGTAGADRFDFDAVTDIGKAKGARDLIGNFIASLDDIDFSTIDANSKKPGDQAFKFINKHEFGDKAGQLHYDKINKPGTVNDMTRVEGDTDGNGKADFKLELTGLLKLTADDFVL